MSSILENQGVDLNDITIDDSDSENDEDEDDDNLDEDAVLEHRSLPHLGGVNRVRAQPMPSYPSASEPYHVATWAETGKVHIWNVRPLLESLDVPGYALDKTRVSKPVFTINSHGRAEGFAMDWAASGSTSLRLLTGDVASKIYLTTSTPSGFNALSQPFTSHTSSVEDLQWSPSEPTVFASCSADRSIQIWDVRVKGRRSVAGITAAHDSDVNVISWNKLTSYLLVSGGDEGAIKTWDLRNVQKSGYVDHILIGVSLLKVSLALLQWIRHRWLPLYGTKHQSLPLNGIRRKTPSLLQEARMTRSLCGISLSNMTQMRLEWASLSMANRMFRHSCSLSIKGRPTSRRSTGTPKYRVQSSVQRSMASTSSRPFQSKRSVAITLRLMYGLHPYTPFCTS